MTLKIHRFAGNPILSPYPDLSWASRHTMNPGVIHDGSRFRMLFTAGGEDGTMRLGLATSTDGVHFQCRETPFLEPSPDADDFDHGAVEDPRITRLEDRYYITYAARSQSLALYAQGSYRLGPGGNRAPTWSRNFRRTGLAVTADWNGVKRLGALSSEHMSDANVVLFPEKIGGKYACLHRPTPSTAWLLPMFYYPASLWLVFSERIDHWSSNRREMPWDMVPGLDIPDDHEVIRPEYEWETMKVGGSGVPIATDDGWLTFYHGVDRRGTYRVGLLLLKRDDPRQVLCRTPEPVLEPEAPYERTEPYPGCVFPTANVLCGDEIFLYYGASDRHIGVANLSLRAALAHVKQFPVKG